MSIKKSISFTFGAQVVNTLTGFITSIIITRILGTTGRGEQALFVNSVAFAVLFFGFSINSTIPFFINSGKAKAGELLSTLVVFILGSTLLVYIMLNVLEHFGRLSVVLPGSVQSMQYKLVFTGIYFCNLMSSVVSIYLLTYKKFKEVSIYSVLSLLLPAVVYLLLYLGIIPYDHSRPFIAVLKVIAVTAFISFVAISLLFLKILPVRPGIKLVPVVLVRQFILFSGMAYLGNIATFFNYKLDFWVVDAYFGKASLGIYSLASQLSQLLWVLPSALASVLYSFASNCSREQAVTYAIQLKQLAFYGTLVLAAIGLLLAYFFIPILYGSEFTQAFPLMAIFIMGVVPYSIPMIMASLFAARGNFKTSFVISIVSFALSILLYYTFIPRFGLTGGAVASVICYLSATIMSEAWFCKTYNVSALNLLRPDKKIFSIPGISKILR